MAYLSCQPFPLGPSLVVPAIVAASSPSSTISRAVGTNARNCQTTKLKQSFDQRVVGQARNRIAGAKYVNILICSYLLTAYPMSRLSPD